MKVSSRCNSNFYIFYILVSTMCNQCAAEPSPSCWSSCYEMTSRIGITMHDAVARPYCYQCASEPSASCWETCYAMRATFTEEPAAYCSQCQSEPSSSCWDTCFAAQFSANKVMAKAVEKFISNQTPVAYCAQCQSEPSASCWETCY